MAEGSREGGRRLRLARLASGLSQLELARAARISRQAVAGVEAGVWSPSLAVALRLAGALDRTVEQLFAPARLDREASVSELAPGAGAGGRAVAVEVFGRLVGVPRDGQMAAVPGFGPASARFLGAGKVASGSAPEETILVAGCDPALPLLESGLRSVGAGWRLAWWPCGSGEAVRLLAAGLVHAAAVHHPVGARARTPPGAVPIGFARWREGLVSRPGEGERVGDLAEAVGRGLTIANREPAAEARELLDRELAKLGAVLPPGYRSEYRGHIPVATAVAARGADFGVATEPVAIALDLDFSPLSEEESILLLPADRLEGRELGALLLGLGDPALAAQIAAIRGYDAGLLAEEL